MIIAHQQQKRRIEIFAKVNKTLSAGINHVFSKVPRMWLKERGISAEATFAGFCSGQIHSKCSEEFIRDLEFIRFIRSNNITSQDKKTGYLVFADYGITFPLRDIKGNVVNYFGIPLQWKKQHICFLNDDGIYPGFPHEMTTRLFITTDIIDTATLLQVRIMDNREAVMCIPNGKILPQHEEAIKRLTQLQSITWIQSPEMKLKKPLEGRVMPEGYVTKPKKKP